MASHGPRCTITPVFTKDPVHFDTTLGPLPPILDSILTPLPTSAGRLAAAVCVPFYSEDGFALARGLQGLALQRADLRRYHSVVKRAPPERLPEIHVFAIADGWKKGDGSLILSASMLEELTRIFPNLDVEAVRSLLEDFDGAHGPTSVIIQFVQNEDGREVLAPIPLDCSRALSMACRTVPTSGIAVSSINSAVRLRNRERKRLIKQLGRSTSLPTKFGSIGSLLSRGSPSPPPLQPSSSPQPLGSPQGSFGSSPSFASPPRPQHARSSIERHSSQSITSDMDHRHLLSRGAFFDDGDSLREMEEEEEAVDDTDWETSLETALRNVYGIEDGSPIERALFEGVGNAAELAAYQTSLVAEPELDGATVHDVDSEIQPIFFTLMIKRENARKHHSHRWFFEAFGPVTRLRSQLCPYYFATDCGTLYAPYLLAELIIHLERNPACAACTGHQRIMDVCDQAEPGAEEAGESWGASILRSVQAYDFESGLCMFNGMHQNAGFLPVVPGPCGLFRVEACTDSMVKMVRDICDTPPEADGLIQGNLKIAEDRILSYLLVLCQTTDQSGRTREWNTQWVPSTTFYFEAETTLKEFVLQRRRWLNGTTAGYVWLLQNEHLWEALSRRRVLAVLVLLMSILQLVVFGIVFCLPGIMVITGFLAIDGLFVVLELARFEVPYAYEIQQGFLALLFLSFIAHVYYARFGSSNFNPCMWKIRVAVNATQMALNLAVTSTLLAVSLANPSALLSIIGQGNFRDMQLAGALGILFVTTPYFLAVLHSPDSFVMMVKTYFFYFFFLPTIVSDFFAYSLARYDDLSWGTKAVANAGSTTPREMLVAAAALTVAHAQSSTTPRETLKAAGVEALIIDQPQLSMYRVPNKAPLTSTAAASTTRRRESPVKKLVRRVGVNVAAVRAKSSRQTTALASIQVIVYTLLSLVSLWLNSAVKHYLLIVSAAMCSTGFAIMLLSMAYFVPRSLCGRGSGSMITRVLSFVNFVGWICAVTMLVGMVVFNWKGNSKYYSDSVDAFYATYGALMAVALLRFLPALCGCGGSSRSK